MIKGGYYIISILGEIIGSRTCLAESGSKSFSTGCPFTYLFVSHCSTQ